MPDRTTLHDLIDRLPGDKLECVQKILEGVLDPDALLRTPEAQWMRERHQEITNKFREHIEQIRAGDKSGCIGGAAGGSGRFGHGPTGLDHGHISQSWWEGSAHVTHSVIRHRGHELHLTERIAMTEDRKKLIFAHEVVAANRAVKHEEQFDVSPA